MNPGIAMLFIAAIIIAALWIVTSAIVGAVLGLALHLYAKLSGRRDTQQGGSNELPDGDCFPVVPALKTPFHDSPFATEEQYRG